MTGRTTSLKDAQTQKAALTHATMWEYFFLDNSYMIIFL